MELKRGQVVRSLAGRDQGRFMAVVEAGGGAVWGWAGKDRPVSRPKRKNPRHLAPTWFMLPQEALATDRKLRAALRAEALRELTQRPGERETNEGAGAPDTAV